MLICYKGKDNERITSMTHLRLTIENETNTKKKELAQEVDNSVAMCCHHFPPPFVIICQLCSSQATLLKHSPVPTVTTPQQDNALERLGRFPLPTN